MRPLAIAGPVLHIGCGTSLLADELTKAGLSGVVNTDISVNALVALRSALPGAECAVADVLSLSIRSCSVGCVVDKGTFDAIAAGANKRFTATAMMTELQRVVGPGGHIFIVSIFPPEDRIPLFGLAGPVDVAVQEIPHAPLELPAQKCFWLYTIVAK